MVVPAKILGLGPERVTTALLYIVLKQWPVLSCLKTQVVPPSDELIVSPSFVPRSVARVLCMVAGTLVGDTRVSSP